jgi:hypothetical protein
MGNESTTITTPTVVRQTQEPQALDGRIWINPSGGNSGNNTERYIYNRDNNAWELDTAIGPDTPTKEVDGAVWRDTSKDPPKSNVYSTDTASWEGVISGNTLSASATGKYNFYGDGTLSWSNGDDNDGVERTVTAESTETVTFDLPAEYEDPGIMTGVMVEAYASSGGHEIDSITLNLSDASTISNNFGGTNSIDYEADISGGLYVDSIDITATNGNVTDEQVVYANIRYYTPAVAPHTHPLE